VNNSFRLLVFILIAAATAIGCSEQVSTPGSPSSATGSLTLTAEQLAGPWALASIQPAGQASEAKPAGAEYTLTFADNRLSTKADCNVCTGAATLSDQMLTAGPLLACTRAACPTMAFESSYTRLLAGESVATVTASTLILSSDRGELRFTR
jgi:heat shock protein HslJ